jgi:UDP-N-acetylglucosamine--N-acetylmuramyl-(pentapeptide) pyrophosphoryl-undecaprenol N-acetylglucosamine transferase
VAELAAIGRASILVPFPHAADDHQYRNAAALAGTGGAVCIRQEDTVPRLGEELARLLHDDVARAAMARAARQQGRPNAARDIAEDLLALARIPLSRPRVANGASTTSAQARPVGADH